MTPQELVTAAQNGDRDAFAQLWRMYYGEVMAVIYRRTHNRHTAEDLTSETFLRAWKRLPNFTWQGSGFIGWIITIAINATNDHFNAAHQRLNRHFPDGDFEAWPAASTDRRTDPQQIAEHDDLARTLDTAIAELTDDQRKVLAVRFGLGMTLSETGDLLGRRSGTIASTQHRAAVAMRNHPALAALAAA